MLNKVRLSSTYRHKLALFPSLASVSVRRLPNVTAHAALALTLVIVGLPDDLERVLRARFHHDRKQAFAYAQLSEHLPPRLRLAHPKALFLHNATLLS